MAVTLAEIAALAGVSRGTVDRALNDRGRVDPKVAARVRRIAADCTAYAYANFHQDFIRGKVTLVGCPKLDDVDYSEKLTEILRQNNIKSVTVVRMEVPCCGGLEHAVRTALQNCGKLIPWQVHTVSVQGELL